MPGRGFLPTFVRIENLVKATMKKLVIFDLDGTLLNTLGDLAASCNYLMEQHGYPTHPLDRYRYLVGNKI